MVVRAASTMPHTSDGRSISNYPTLIPLLLLLSVLPLPNHCVEFLNEFQNPVSSKGFFLQRMVLDPTTGRLFVGGINHLYDLHSEDLSIRTHVDTGPHKDSLSCRNRNDSCDAARHATDSHTKALAVYDKSSSLIECSNLFQGRCRLRNLHKISEVLAESSEPMLANDEKSSAVVFVGDGPSDPVLYVASTFVRGPLFRDDIPAVASVRLTRNDVAKEFDLAEKLLATGTSISLERKHRTSYKIDYVGGFQSGDYAYFATRQGKTLSEESHIQSRLVRVCTGDPHFYSYTEVPLECSHGEEDFNLLTDVFVGRAGYNLAKSLSINVDDEVLYGVFVAGDPSSLRKELPLFRSALCVYPMADVEETFKANILDCYRGIVLKQLPWFKSSDQCKATRLQWKDVACGKDVNANIGGGKAIQSKAVLVTEDVRFTAVAVNTTRASTVAFIGTDDGRLLKVLIESAVKADVYATEKVANGEAILQDMEISGNGKSIFILTPTKVIKMATSSCDRSARTCFECLSARDPYCGWCLRTNSCSEEESCEKVLPNTASGWLDFQDTFCPIIKSVVPDKIQITTADYLNVTVDNIEEGQNQVRCSFQFEGGIRVDGPGTRIRQKTIRCETPDKSRLPSLPVGASQIVSTLSIVADRENAVPIASTNFSFYDCSRFRTCSLCTGSTLPCDWCLESNECVAGKLTEDKCRRQHIVNGLNREGHSRRKGPSKCPHLVAPQSHLYVAVGERRNLSVKIQNLDPTIMDEFRCEFRIGETKHEKPAVRSGEDTIVCGEMRFDQAGSEGLLPVAFDVVWTSAEASKPHVIDNTHKVAVEVYKCERLASDCGTCITLDSSFYDCGWCRTSNSCSRQGECAVSQWLNGSHLCANPKIIDVTPKKGPFGGKTVLRIKGINLGRRASDVTRAVQVANVPCEVVPEEYKPAKEIVCVTGKATGTENKGPVVIRLKPDNYSYVAVSGFDFVYVQPTISRIQPSRGPRSGGTDVTLQGTDLDAGSQVYVQFGKVDCRLLRRSSNELTCRTTASTSDGPLPLRIIFDDSHTRLPISINFEFSSPPRVHTIRPKYVFAAGGMQIDVSGQGFSLLQRPRMLLIGDRGRREVGPVCVVENDALMKCESPRLPEGDRQPTHANSPVKASYAFELDGMVTESDRIDIFTNPTVEPFSETRYYRAGDDSLTINGNNLNLAATERDFSVRIGGVDCPLTSVASRVLTCIPPPTKPLLPSGTQPEVVVKIGNLNYQAGILSYDSPGLATSLLLLITFFVILVTLLFVCLFIVYRRKSNTQERKLRHLKMQMDTIEMKVATECKQAFAELQTSLDQYTAELPLGTPPAPFLTYREYCARVLFPNNPHNHPVFQSVQVFPERANAVETALRELHKLLMNKTFLLTMVRSMENNKYFVAKDRVYVGSLLMVVLQEKMGYCTELLKQLLRELIERTVEKKLQPKILFRRSESVAERMLTAWFTFLMYDHLQRDPGRCLYNLYYSIKQQIEKGPQDALTQESRYSLSEEKLLRATFDYQTLDVFVETEITGVGNLLVKVLDCDSITQAKKKCIEVKYRAVPYSNRPSPSDLDLEWVTGRNGRIKLQDIDETSRVEAGGWRRINTLAHYNLHNRAILALIQKQKPFYEPSFLSDHSSLASRTSPPMSRAWQSISNSPSKEMDTNYKLYHLVKPAEHGPNEGQEKMVTEIYLTRLLMMKGTLQTFIDELLDSIFLVHKPAAPLPAVIKYMFDFMDEQAAMHGITDPEVSHAWKSNALPLRFWVNLIKNPHFLFDIPKPTTVEGCLSVVAQTLMDACSTQDHQLTKDSPSSKLLFAKDMYKYRDLVDSYYTEIRRLDRIKEDEMAALLEKESRHHKNEFEVFPALMELYKYIEQYKEQLMDALEANEHATASRLNIRLQDMLALMESDGDRTTDYESSTLGMGYNSSSRLMARERL